MTMTDDARCWRCEGTGMVQYEDHTGTFTHHQLCPKCEGTGRPKRDRLQTREQMLRGLTPSHSGE